MNKSDERSDEHAAWQNENRDHDDRDERSGVSLLEALTCRYEETAAASQGAPGSTWQAPTRSDLLADQSSPEQLEAARLAALARYRVLDTPPEQAFNRLTRLAARFLDVPVAAVHFIDARQQWTKAIYGSDSEGEWLPRDISFCAEAIREEGLTIVEDLRADPRFQDNPLVSGEPYFRFYTSANLVTPDGYRLGTLCVLDTEPRERPSAEWLDALQDFADIVMDELELRRVADYAARQSILREVTLAALHESEARLRAIVDHTTDLIYVKDTDGRYLMANPATARALGIPADEVVGQDDVDIFGAEYGATLKAIDQQVIRTGEPHVGEDVPNLGGERRVFLTTKFPYRNPNGAVLGIVGISRDITARSDQARALQAAKDEATRANNAKDQFLSQMSHELRTPLNAMLGFAQLLDMDVDLAEEQRESVGHILTAGQHLLGLVEDVLDLATISSGNISVEKETVEVGDLLEDVSHFFAKSAADQGIALQVEECHGTVSADSKRLRQVVFNLVSNAIKYNETGGDVRVFCDAPTPDRLRIYIRDDGYGIPKAEQQQLFDPFFRASTTKGAVEGVGIGLALARRMMRLMGGDIGFESAEGEGSTFWVEVPRA
ncbi:MAG: ATP-binding protein [Trueperaceae bacterium]|nr:ATP-binding protein [Trueperaceae bacterium]